MGLPDRRAIKAFQENSFPALQDKMIAALGFAPEIEVDWDTLAEDDMGHMYEENLPQVYFAPAETAFAAVCVDDMGREAAEAAIKRIVFQHKADNHVADYWAKLEGGVLTLDHKPNSNVSQANDRAQALQSVLEAAL